MEMRKDFLNFLRFLEKKLGGRIELVYRGREQSPLGPHEFYRSAVIHQRPDGDRYELGILTMVYSLAQETLIRKGYYGKIPGVKNESTSLCFEAPSHLALWAMVVYETEKSWERNDGVPNIPFP